MDTPNVNATTAAGLARESSRLELSRPEQPNVNSIDTFESESAPRVYDLKRAVELLNDALSREPVALQFRIDETLNRPVVSVISEETGEIVHQLPKDEVLRAVKNLDVMRGILFDGNG